ncbi:MAG TPA: glycine cleavage system protein H [Chloroflexi bacterium]|nr:glycine cleavage system protein H [Chloroflexota bacterium]
MKIGDYEFPDDLYYDKDHNWARVEDNIVTQGLSDFGQDLAGELVYVEVPRVGRKVEKGKPFMSMESGKWVGRVNAMVSGEIVEVNEELEWEPSLINESPYEKGWLVKIKAEDLGELEGYLCTSDPAFAEFIAAEREKYGK